MAYKPIKRIKCPTKDCGREMTPMNLVQIGGRIQREHICVICGAREYRNP